MGLMFVQRFPVICRKEGTTQNVLAAITFDLKFTFVVAGWEGSAHDYCILTSALSRPKEFEIPRGIFHNLKFCLINNFSNNKNYCYFVR